MTRATPNRDAIGQPLQDSGGFLFVARLLLACFGFLLIPLTFLASLIILTHLDTSVGVADELLDMRLKNAIGCEMFTPEWDDSIYWGETQWHVTGDLSDHNFAGRVRSVTDWEQIALIAPNDTGAVLAEDPELTSWWMRRRLAQTPDEPDYKYRLLAVRHQAVVADFRFEVEQNRLHTVLVSRVPSHRDPPTFWRWYALLALAGLGVLLLVRLAIRKYGWLGGSVRSLFLGCLAVLALATVLGFAS